MQDTPLHPENEMDRITALSLYNLDYDTLRGSFSDLTQLAAKITGTEISLINLLDNYNQWTVGLYGIPIDNMPREESVCQYTILDDNGFEVPDLADDKRFNEFEYVTGGPHLKYYYGVPIKTGNGYNIGALCVLDREKKKLSQDKKEMLQILAQTVITRLAFLEQTAAFKRRIAELSSTKKMLAHDIRGPLGGIVGLAQLAGEELSENKTDELAGYLKMIAESGTSVIHLADDILNAELKHGQELPADYYNLLLLQDKLNHLFMPRAMKKKLKLSIHISPDTAAIPFHKARLLQILGNLTSNAIKFTQTGGYVNINLVLVADKEVYTLKVIVTDNGLGMAKSTVDAILQGKGKPSTGTSGEEGYGLGLVLVKQIIDDLKGKMKIKSAKGEGTEFIVTIPGIVTIDNTIA